MRKLLIGLLFILTSLSLHAQCNGTQSFTLNPAPPPGGYLPGTAVNVCYTMNGWNGTNVQSNWLEGFDINLGPGWTNLTPGAPPANCNGGGGQWLWMNSTTSSATGITVGPGWFFEGPAGGPTDGNPGNDWGDFGTTCSWTFCFTVTVAQGCTPQNLLIQVTAGADGTWGSWGNNACPQTPFTVYNGNSSAQPIPLGAISHN
jgi:hypothetical protein